MKVRLLQHWFILNYEAKMKNHTYLIHVYAASAARESGIGRARGEKIDCECSVTKPLSMLTPATYLSFITAPDIDRSSTKDSWRTGRTGGGAGATPFATEAERGIPLGCCRQVTGHYQMEVKRSFMVMERPIVYLGNCAQGHHCRWKWGAARNLHKCKFAVQLATINGGL